ncbi:MAG: FecR domain-containing protein [Rariglobus sp.]|nr:FecR domain-containing protein [Rariglobus sp.]
MKKSIQSLLIAAIVSVTVVCVQAAETASEVVVLKVKGAAKAVLPGTTTPVEVKAGSTLPQGTILETAEDAQVELQVFPGIVTTIKAGSKVDLSKISLTTAQGVVTKQSAIIGLSVGSVVSKLDPSKKSINDYSVSTPKGVAAARGTEYTVVVASNGEVRLYVKNGSVTLTPKNGGPAVVVQAGFYVTVGADGSISAPVESSNSDVNSDRDPGTDKEAKEMIDTTIIVSPSA